MLKPIYLSGKLGEAFLSLYSVRLKMTNAVGLKPRDEVWGKIKTLPQRQSYEDKPIPRVWSIQPREIPALVPTLCAPEGGRPRGRVTAWTLGIRRCKLDSVSPLLNDLGMILGFTL